MFFVKQIITNLAHILFIMVELLIINRLDDWATKLQNTLLLDIFHKFNLER